MKSRNFGRQIAGLVNNTAQSTIWFATCVVTEVDIDTLKVRVEVLPDGVETNWIRLTFPLAGQTYGMFFLPEVGTELGILFEGADPNSGIAIGCLVADDDEPPKLQSPTDFIIMPKEGGSISITKADGIIIKSDHVYCGDKDGSKKLLTEDFLTKYNSDMSLIMAHTNMVAPDPTLTTIGSAQTAGNATTKTKAV